MTNPTRFPAYAPFRPAPNTHADVLVPVHDHPMPGHAELVPPTTQVAPHTSAAWGFDTHTLLNPQALHASGFNDWTPLQQLHAIAPLSIAVHVPPHSFYHHSNTATQTGNAAQYAHTRVPNHASNGVPVSISILPVNLQAALQLQPPTLNALRNQKTTVAQAGYDAAAVMQGLLLGDALGAPTESIQPSKRIEFLEQRVQQRVQHSTPFTNVQATTHTELAARQQALNTRILDETSGFGAGHHSTDDTQQAALALACQIAPQAQNQANTQTRQGTLNGDVLSMRFALPHFNAQTQSTSPGFFQRCLGRGAGPSVFTPAEPFTIYGGAQSLRNITQNQSLAWPLRALLLPASAAGPSQYQHLQLADTAGNGGLMRIASTILPHLVKLGSSANYAQALQALWADVITSTQVTHPSSFAHSVNLAYCVLLLELIAHRRLNKPLPERFFINTMQRVCEAVETQEQYRLDPAAQCPVQEPSLQSCWTTAFRLPSEFLVAKPQRVHSQKPEDQAVVQSSVAWVLQHMQQHGLPGTAMDPEVARIAHVVHRWHSRSYLGATWPTVVFLLETYGYTNPEKALRMAAVVTQDNDTCAAIVGAAMGAYHGGGDGSPNDWMTRILPRNESTQALVVSNARINPGHPGYSMEQLLAEFNDYLSKPKV